MLMNFRNPQATLQLHHQEPGMAFTQENDCDSQWEQSAEYLQPGQGCQGGYGF